MIYYLDMDRKIIRITENELKKIIRKSVNEALNMTSSLDDDIDITKIPIDILKRGYFDYRLVPVSSYYGSPISSPTSIKEAIGDIMSPDIVSKNITQKYNLPSQFVIKKEHFHKICVYVITAVIGINDKLIEGDMKKMGYFLSKKGDVVEVQDMRFQILQFEPLSQMQEDITNDVKTNFTRLYHWAPSYNVDDILRNGLIPSSKNEVFKYPPRTYLMEGDSTDEERLYLGRLLCAANTSPNNSGEYALLIIDISDLDEKIRFYYDPNSEIGIYTEQPISNDRIKIEEVVQLKKPQK